MGHRQWPTTTHVTHPKMVTHLIYDPWPTDPFPSLIWKFCSGRKFPAKLFRKFIAGKIGINLSADNASRRRLVFITFREEIFGNFRTHNSNYRYCFVHCRYDPEPDKSDCKIGWQWSVERRTSGSLSRRSLGSIVWPWQFQWHCRLCRLHEPRLRVRHFIIASF